MIVAYWNDDSYINSDIEGSPAASRQIITVVYLLAFTTRTTSSGTVAVAGGGGRWEVPVAENRATISTFYGGKRDKSLLFWLVTRFQTLQTGTRVSSLMPPPLPPTNKTFALYHHKLSPLKSFLKSTYIRDDNLLYIFFLFGPLPFTRRGSFFLLLESHSSFLFHRGLKLRRT